MYRITYEDVLQGSQKFVQQEKRGSMYKVATFLVDHFWYKPSDIADGIGVLLLVWNQAFYRYCNFALDFENLERCLEKNEKAILQFRQRNISSFNKTDMPTIRRLFIALLEALKCGNRKSPVAVSKALHLLAPNFFPLWDVEISKAYGCHWYDSSEAREKYLRFMNSIKDLSRRIVTSYMNKNNVSRETAEQSIRKEASSSLPFAKSLLKIIDEYNYAKYTKKW